MFYVWITLWVLFALAVAGYVVWSAAVLYEQKKAWTAFAAKYKLTLVGGKKVMEPAGVTGILQGRKITIYSAGQISRASQMIAVTTHIEVHLNLVPPTEIVVASRVLPFALSDFRAPVVFSPPGVAWPVRETGDPQALATWINPTRIAALNTYLALAKEDDIALFICDGVQAFLFWRTENPMRDPRALNALVQKLLTIAKDLDGEAGTMAKPNAAIASTPAAAPLIG